MIKSVAFKNLKALRDVEIELGQLTVFVGPNGVGKSTALMGMRMLSAVLCSPSTSPDARERLRHLMPDEQSFCFMGKELHSRSDAFEVAWSTSVRQVGLRVAWVGDASLSVDVNGGPNVDQALQDALHRPLALQLEPDLLASPSAAAQSAPTLSERGAGLATVLEHLASRRDGRIDAIEAGLRSLVPPFRRVHTAPARVVESYVQEVPYGAQVLKTHQLRELGGFELSLEFEGLGSIPAEHVSEGTLLALGLLTMLHLQPANLILIDDADRALHPAAQQQMVGLFYKILKEKPDLQIVMTTHSPDLVNACDPKDVRVFGATSEGTKVRSLADHPEAERWLKMLRGGEFWSTVGEEWVGEAPTGDAKP